MDLVPDLAFVKISQSTTYTTLCIFINYGITVAVATVANSMIHVENVENAVLPQECCPVECGRGA